MTAPASTLSQIPSSSPAAMPSPFEAIAVVSPGLESVAAAELTALGAEAVQPLHRAVACRCDQITFQRLHLQARLPFRLLRQLARFPCQSRDELRRQLPRAVDWALWLPPERSFRVEVTGSGPGLNHSHYTALEVKNALVDLQRQHWGRRSDVDLDNPELVLHLHLGRGEAVLSLVGTAGSLHRRGWRPALGLAPLKENLAAGLIALTGWDGRVPLLDPLCGSGTLLLEAAAAALNRAPGLGRQFLFEHWPDFEAAAWRQQGQEAQAQARDRLADGSPLAPILGLERDPEVLTQARANAKAAGLDRWVDLRQGDLRRFEPPPGPGLIVANPPYGARLGETDLLREFYADLGQWLRQRCPGWTVWLLSGNPELSAALRLKASRRIPISNGGIDCRWLRYDIRA